MRRIMNFMAGLFFGALVGSVTALLLAPASGDELKERMNQRVEGLRDEMTEAYEARRAQLEAELETLRQRGKV
ncbi:MAG: YtxH domain-containing protein [Anaerolineales bacterium]|nr:YtxH domain-containing protein [Anaerolineales bacterium]